MNEGEKQIHFRDLLRKEVTNFAAMLKSGSKWQPYGFGGDRETGEDIGSEGEKKGV